MDKKKEPTKVSPNNQEDYTLFVAYRSMADYVEALTGLDLPEGSTTIYKHGGYIRITHSDGKVVRSWHRMREGEEGTYENY